ncbi:hypothetical protein A2U01_0114896, partial [Trifolium medium]|nr:hypothetical protein [Trifolium medium]
DTEHSFVFKALNFPTGFRVQPAFTIEALEAETELICGGTGDRRLEEVEVGAIGTLDFWECLSLIPR